MLDNNVQIGLFYDRKYIFEPLKIANELKNKIEELGEPIILPVDEKSNNPVIVFDKSSQIRIIMNLNNIMLTLANENDKNINNILKSVFEILKKQKINISRIGYIRNVALGIKEANLFKNNAFESNEIINSNEFQLSYYLKDVIDKISINCWKRYFTDYEKFLVSFDINTLRDDKHNINYNFALDFINKCRDYIEKNQIIKLI